MMVLTATQWRTRIEGVISPAGGFIGERISGIDLPAVIKTAEAVDIPVNLSFVEKVRMFEQEVLKAASSNKEADDGPCTPAKKEDCRILYGEYFEATCRMCKDKN